MNLNENPKFPWYFPNLRFWTDSKDAVPVTEFLVGNGVKSRDISAVRPEKGLHRTSYISFAFDPVGTDLVERLGQEMSGSLPGVLVVETADPPHSKIRLWKDGEPAIPGKDFTADVEVKKYYPMDDVIPPSYIVHVCIKSLGKDPDADPVFEHEEMDVNVKDAQVVFADLCNVGEWPETAKGGINDGEQSA